MSDSIILCCRITPLSFLVKFSILFAVAYDLLRGRYQKSGRDKKKRKQLSARNNQLYNGPKECNKPSNPKQDR